MVIPGISIVCFAALSGSSHPLIPVCGDFACFSGYGVLLEYHMSDMVLNDFLYCTLLSSIWWTTLNVVTSAE